MKFHKVLLFSILSLPCAGQETATFTRNIDSLIHAFITVNDLPGAAVGVVFQDQMIYAKRIIRDRQKSDSIKDDRSTIYNIASVAKPFVATAIMLLAQEQKLDINTPVVKYLPDFKINSKLTKDITIKHLLTHTSGLPNTSQPDDYDYIDVDTTNTALSDHIKSLSGIKLLFKPGKKYSYSNVGFEVLGQVIAKISGMSFDEFMQSQLFQPLGMRTTSYILSDLDADNIAQPYRGHPNQLTARFPYNRAFSPSGNLFTTINDMNKWMIFTLNGCRYGEHKPLTTESYEMLTTPQAKAEDDDEIGLSWFVKDNLLFHDGKDLGYTALMLLYKKQKIGITVLINHLDGDCNALLNQVAKSIKF